MTLHTSPRLHRAGYLALALGLAACNGPTPEASPAPAAAPSDSAAPAEDSSIAKGLRGLASLGRKPAKPWTFDFKDPPIGPRAPTTAALSATIGSSMFADIDALTKQLGLDCGDTSVRAMMNRRRETERTKMAEARARGEDAVTAASWMDKRSKREANPQLRFSCPKVSSNQLTDRTRPPSSGRLLYIFDDSAYPLRHASYQRTHRDHVVALADFEDAVAALTKVYGPPTKPLSGPLPVPDKDGKVEFQAAKNLEVSWEYADLLARVHVLRYGDLVTIGERIEVPHGLRPDAPRFVAGETPPLPPPAGTAMPPVLAAGSATGTVAAAPAAPAGS